MHLIRFLGRPRMRPARFHKSKDGHKHREPGERRVLQHLFQIDRFRSREAPAIDVHVQQIAGSSVLVALGGRDRLQMADAVELEPAQDAADSGAAQAGVGGDAAPGPAPPGWPA